MAPPQFKLSADAADTSGAGNAVGQHASMEAAVEVAPAGGDEEYVSNFGRMTDEVRAATEKKDLNALMVAMEAIKHDQAEWTEFQTHFQTKAGVGLKVYLVAKFGEESIGTLFRNMNSDMSKISATNVADLIKESIDEKNETAVMSLLSCYGSPKEIAAAYSAAYKGNDLRTDLQALSATSPALTTFLQNFYGDRQNYERVRVANPAEATEARTIIARIYDQYGVDVNSQRALDQVRERYPDAPKELVDSIHTQAWTISNLRDVETALSYFAPISGSNRETSSLAAGKHAQQNVHAIGRVNENISRNDGKFSDGNAAGRYYPTRGVVAIFDGANGQGMRSGKHQMVKGKGGVMKEVEVDDGLLMTITHELGHGFLEYACDEFRNTIGYWKGHIDGAGTEQRKVLTDGIDARERTVTVVKGYLEAPPTLYGLEGAIEDLAETVTMYFNNRSRLRRGADWFQRLQQQFQTRDVVGGPCIERMEFMNRVIGKWKAAAPQK